MISYRYAPEGDSPFSRMVCCVLGVKKDISMKNASEPNTYNSRYMTPKTVFTVSPAPDRKKMISDVTAIGRISSHCPKHSRICGRIAGSRRMLVIRVRI